MKKLTYEEMFFKLKNRFPGIEIKDSKAFSYEYEYGQSLWLRNASSITYTNIDKNTLSALDTGIYNSKLYDIDVYIKFDKWCNKYGWYASTENYTLQLFKLYMGKKELIEFILKAIEKTHSEKDKQDLLDFSESELNRIYNEIIESNK